MSNPLDAVVNSPNFKLSMEASQKLLQLQDKVNKALIVVSLENQTCGSVLLSQVEKPLTDQAKINILLEVMRKLEIPFKLLKDLR